MIILNLILRIVGLLLIVSAGFTWITYKYPKINIYGLNYEFFNNLNFANINSEIFYWILVCVQGFLGIYLLISKLDKENKNEGTLKEH